MAEQKKTTSKKKPVEAEVVEPPVPAQEEKPRVTTVPKKKYRSGSIFWGITFIIVGTLFLLDNLGILSVHFANIWQLWPILIIGAGVSMLSLRGWLSGILAVLLALTFGALAYLVAVDNPYYNNQTNSNSGQVTTLGGDIANTAKDGLNLTLKTGAVDLNLTSNSSQAGYEAELSSDYLSLHQTNYTVVNDVQYVTLETSSESGWWMGMNMGRMHNNLNVDLTENSPLTVNIETGASTVTGDFSSTRLKSFSLNAGASNIDLKFGSRVAKQDITLEAGASKIVLNVPTDSGVRIESDSGLSHTYFQDVDKVNDSLSDNVYESAGFSSAKSQIIIHAKVGVSSLELRRY